MKPDGLYLILVLETKKHFSIPSLSIGIGNLFCGKFDIVKYEPILLIFNPLAFDNHQPKLSIY
jgi:hypothetical protein